MNLGCPYFERKQGIPALWERVRIRSTMALSQPDSPISPVMHSAVSLLKCPECGYAMPGESLATTLPSSRFEELSSRNDPPVDSERTALEAVVREGEANLSSLPQRIAAVRETLKILLKEQARTVKHITDAKSLLNPVSRLPGDVLIEIFTACLPEYTEDSLNAKTAPWVLSQVCASWRQTALASAGLWAKVHLKMDLYANHMESVFRLGTVLDRAGKHLLRVSIQGRKDFSHHPVFAMILPTSARWKSLDVAASLRSFRLFNSISHCLPLLEILKLKVSGFHRSDIRPDSTSVYGFRQAPRLRELSVTQQLVSDTPFFSNLFALPLEKISELYLISTTSDVVSLLRSNGAKHLVTFVITLVDSEDRALPQRIEIPVIRQVGLQNLALIGSAVWLLSRLRLPALQRLNLFLSEGPVIPVISEHTAPALTELTINSDDYIHGRALTNMLQWTPNLSAMILEIIIKDDTLFTALGRSRDGGFELVPHLKIFSLEGTRLEFLDHGHVITDMVESRRTIPSGEGQAALKIVCLKDDLGDSERWEKLRQGGLIVRYGA
ncbi:hypothetical protein ARMSODRAFT_806819 [Armillaria solidipes]|uniref:F-box domain-containing protein n=1 Tax=Armillaria solidipes TaxID=1076256 RepID=A0A2H3AJV1_9AGAR|nr:hypothetical protein ARMSODRAFT_806819 [Armillaria solidipes]